jgi:hypothetical protein
VLSSPIRLAGDTTIPATVHVRVDAGGSIDLAGYTLTIAGTVDAPPRPWLRGSGCVRYADHISAIQVAWRGRDSDALQATIDDCRGDQVAILAGKYQVDEQVTITRPGTRISGGTIEVEGEGYGIVIAAPDEDPIAGVWIWDTHLRVGDQASGGIRAIRASRLMLDHIEVTGGGDIDRERSGIRVSGSVAPTIRDARVAGIRWGLDLDTWALPGEVKRGTSALVERPYIDRCHCGVLVSGSHTTYLHAPTIELCGSGIYLEEAVDTTIAGGHVENAPVVIDGAQSTRAYGVRSRDARPALIVRGGAKRVRWEGALPDTYAWTVEAGCEDIVIDGETRTGPSAADAARMMRGGRDA